MLRDVKSSDNLKVLSFGCGPCTDLLALDCLWNTREYSYRKLEYRGVDYSEVVWSRV
jgi:hypothetical protein